MKPLELKALYCNNNCLNPNINSEVTCTSSCIFPQCDFIISIGRDNFFSSLANYMCNPKKYSDE